jgi:SprB-like repeat protein
MKRIAAILFFIFLSSCTYLSVEELTVDCIQTPIMVETIVINADCGVDNGSITIEAVGGNMPYDYQIGASRQLDPVFNGLVAGNYQIILTDAKGCTISLEATVPNNEGVTATASATIAGCKTFQGKITVIASKGQNPYQYSINGGPAQSSNIFTNLDYGIYSILIKDDLDCEFTLGQTLLSGVSYAQSIEPIIMNNCAVTGCHNGSQFPDLQSYENVKSNSARIKEFTQSGFMPQSGSLTQAQKDAIACWVDDGAKNN